MFVPEAAIYKYYCPIFRKDYIRTPRRCSNIFSVTKTFREIYFLLFLLLFCISASDVRHIFTANITRMIISHFYRPQPIFDLFKLLCKTFCDCFSHDWRHSITNLLILLILCTAENKAVRKRLQTRGFSYAYRSVQLRMNPHGLTNINHCAARLIIGKPQVYCILCTFCIRMITSY